jgi:hypothetical protein
MRTGLRFGRKVAALFSFKTPDSSGHFLGLFEDEAGALSPDRDTFCDGDFDEV